MSDVIHHGMLVSEVNRRYPQCRPVFEQYGIAGCGGDFGPPEPLFLFAAAHRVPVAELVAELNAAVRGEWKPRPDTAADKNRSLAEERTTEHLYKWYVAGALVVALTLGFGLGVINLTRIAWAGDYAAVAGIWKQWHGHAQIMGWTGLFIMGVALHALPRMKMQPLRPLWAGPSAGALVFVGVMLRMVPWRSLVWVSAWMELAGIGLFVLLVARLAWRSRQRWEPYEWFIAASCIWLVVLGGLNVWNVAHRMPALSHAMWIHIGLFGFVANMIFGFSLRVLPHFLGLREPRAWAVYAACALWNAAIVVRYPVEWRAWTATGLELAATALVIHALGIFAKRRVKISIPGVDPAFGWFVMGAYGWLVVVALTPLHADLYRLSASSRHLMGVGFITAMMLGVGYRVLPIFNGVNLWSNRLMRVSFWHWAAGSTLSLAMASNKAYDAPWSYLWAGIGGWLVWAAVAMFALNIGMTLRVRHEPYRRGEPVTAHTRVAELLEAYPDLRPVMIHNGLAGLAAMRHNPPQFVTLEFAARRHGIEVEPLVRALNEAIRQRAATSAQPETTGMERSATWIASQKT
ncbi:MAG: DUF1858 domain-containing protein [Verrucomicrobiae bacterium]|nr:DUF1858 domain-containing protein [Verrucomicrobiae bacterium]